MPDELLNEREFELINIIGAEINCTQRDLSHHMDLSLGMTNMLIRRLISKGYIRIRQLNKKKVKYILTTKGFSEKMRKSVKYTLKTIQSIRLIKERVKEILLPLYEQGERNFYILGESDLALLISMVFEQQKIKDVQVHYLHEMPSEKIAGTLLICKEGYKNGKYSNNYINLIDRLAKENNLMDSAKGV